MSSLTDRLRGIVSGGSMRTGGSAPLDVARGALSESRRAEQDPPCEVGDGDIRRVADPDPESRIPDPGSRVPSPGSRAPDRAADVLGGKWREDGSQRFLVIERTYAPGYRHGTALLADSLPPEGGWPRFPLLGGSSGGRTPVFLDLETTGLAGGAGTYAFLVGCAWFDGGRFRIRQFFLSSFAAERALLAAVAEVAQAAGTMVTYNGKTFDLPLIETRYTLNRLPTPFAGIAHVDLLHPARRLWRKDDGVEAGIDDEPIAWRAPSCRLATLESAQLGHERIHDVAGFEIPARYFRYVHSGDPAPLAGVLEHNRLDLLSLACLTARAVQLLDEGAAAAETPREALGLGRLYERAGMTEDALRCYTRASDLGPPLQADALRAYALLARRARRFAHAAQAWERLLGLHDCPPHVEREAAEALAVHHEHRLRSLVSARTLALRSLGLDAKESRRRATKHRLARLDRKIEFHEAMPALF